MDFGKKLCVNMQNTDDDNQILWLYSFRTPNMLLLVENRRVPGLADQLV